jgi:tetratricopeptide (TPR) repeat protein
MRAFVFTDPALSKQAGRFVWLDIDTEKAQNAAFRKQYPVQALPTFFVVDPATEKVALRWVGGATVGQLEKLLADGRRAVAGGGKPAGPSRSRAADQALARADRLYGEGKNAEAVAEYEAALAQAPPKWPSHGRAVESLLIALAFSEQYDKGARLARDTFPRLARTPSAANVAGTGLDCALQMPKENAERAALVEFMEKAALQVVDDPRLEMADDDRSGVLQVLVQARQDAQDSTGARLAAERWAGFLEGAAARAAAPEARTVFDSHRLTAYLELGQPERAIPMLEAAERELPQDYNPPARLAVAYRRMERWDEGLAASERALAKAYGPRQLGILQNRADLFLGKGDAAEARRTLEQALALADSLPPGQRSESTVANLRKKLDGLPKP